MTPTTFPQSNTRFTAPPGLDDTQCQTINGFMGQIKGGNLDGARNFVVAWQPSEEELKRLNSGFPVFVSFLGGIPAHIVCTTFEEATGL